MPPAEPEPVLVSACLLGRRCRYDGRENRDVELERFLASHGMRAVGFCPEEEGGLGTPRSPAWIERTGAAAVLDGTDRVVNEDGEDVTGGFLEGARKALEACRAHGIVRAFLKERSPSCGTGCTHVGGEVVAGRGVTAELLERAGVRTEAGDGPRD